MGEKLVYPWCVVMANLEVQMDKVTGLPSGKSTSGLRDDLKRDGFNPHKVTPVWNSKGFSGYAVAEFKSNMEGYENAMRLGRRFESQGLGKIAWESGVQRSPNRLFGWVATSDDFNDMGPVGRELKKRKELRTVAELRAIEERRRGLVAQTMKRERGNEEEDELGSSQRRRLSISSDEEWEDEEGEDEDGESD